METALFLHNVVQTPFPKKWLRTSYYNILVAINLAPNFWGNSWGNVYKELKIILWRERGSQFRQNWCSKTFKRVVPSSRLHTKSPRVSHTFFLSAYLFHSCFQCIQPCNHSDNFRLDPHMWLRSGMDQVHSNWYLLRAIQCTLNYFKITAIPYLLGILINKDNLKNLK